MTPKNSNKWHYNYLDVLSYSSHSFCFSNHFLIFYASVFLPLLTCKCISCSSHLRFLFGLNPSILPLKIPHNSVPYHTPHPNSLLVLSNKHCTQLRRILAAALSVKSTSFNPSLALFPIPYPFTKSRSSHRIISQFEMGFQSKL
jgi:hypothetical protein